MLIICAAIDDQLVCNIDGDAYVKGYGLPVDFICIARFRRVIIYLYYKCHVDFYFYYKSLGPKINFNDLLFLNILYFFQKYNPYNIIAVLVQLTIWTNETPIPMPNNYT